MIIVLVEVESSVEAIAGIREALVDMQSASRAEEGCHDYTFCQEVADPGRMRILEVWESMDALRFHFGTPHMASFRETLAASPPGKMSVKVHELGVELEMPS
jgi:quinol monooxygenase YgiN